MFFDTESFSRPGIIFSERFVLFCFVSRRKKPLKRNRKCYETRFFFLASKNSSIFADAGNFFPSVDF